ncbi:MAG TPA: exodeoxyribonuclease III [Bacteroidales bacterium]|nr:exodeoxyribonuclease III [Bacteroidales bacterium]
MKIISFNLNGIRSAQSKGLAEWVKAQNADILCVQETKAQPDQIETAEFEAMGYVSRFHSAQKPGYSGVALFSKVHFDSVICGIGIDEFDYEGRFIRADFKGVSLINSYFPSGTMGDVRQEVKMKYLDAFYNYTENLKKSQPNIIVCGDFNICHKEIDISKPENKKGVSGFLPEEREWVSKFIESGFTDSFRHFNKQSDQYTWWSYRAGARKKNLGWRIDYIMTSKPLDSALQAAAIHSDVYMSDHCPISVQLSLK